MKIIITDAGSRKAYDIANILGNVHNFELLLFSSTGYLFQLPVIYGQKVHRLRDENINVFEKDLISALSKDDGEEYCYIPLSEETTLKFYELIEQDFDLNISFLLPDKQAFSIARNKKQFQFFCEKNRMPVPESFEENTVIKLTKNFRPVIAKKNIGAGSMGMKYIENYKQLNILDEIDFDSYLVQEKVESDRKIHGGFYLCKDGDVKVYHGHERIRTYPEKGGVTVYSKATYNQELKNIGESLLKKLNWNGFAMIEFMFDLRNSEWKIIELNPRLWGSVMLSEFCNSSLLLNYIKLCKEEDILKNEILTDRYIRWIFPFDLLGLLKGKINFADFFRLNRHNTCYINYTYGNWYSNVLYTLYFTFNLRSIKRYFKKLFS